MIEQANGIADVHEDYQIDKPKSPTEVMVADTNAPRSYWEDQGRLAGSCQT